MPRKPKGLPYVDDIWLSENYVPGKLPESMNYDWMRYHNMSNSFPPEESKLKFPEELYFIVQKTKVLEFDWMAFNQNIMIVSESFLSFLRANIAEECFEVSKLTTVSRNEKELEVKSQYYAIRIGKYFDDLFDISEINRKRAIGLRDTFIYPDIQIKDKVNGGIFFLSKFTYLEALILTEPIKDVVMREFYKPEIYRIADFPIAYNNRYHKDKLPSTV